MCSHFAGCKKEKEETPKPKPNGPAANFTVTGDKYPYSPLTFKSDAPTGTKHVWYFGNADVSEEVSPTYVYQTILYAPFNDSMFVARLLVNGVETTQEITLTPGLERILKLNNWKKIYTKEYFISNTEKVTDTLRIADTSFTLALSADNLSATLPGEAGNKYFKETRVASFDNVGEQYVVCWYGRYTNVIYDHIHKTATLKHGELVKPGYDDDTLYTIYYISK